MPGHLGSLDPTAFPVGTAGSISPPYSNTQLQKHQPAACLIPYVLLTALGLFSNCLFLTVSFSSQLFAQLFIIARGWLWFLHSIPPGCPPCRGKVPLATHTLHCALRWCSLWRCAPCCSCPPVSLASGTHLSRSHQGVGLV
jgi:hypothetical protein